MVAPFDWIATLHSPAVLELSRAQAKCAKRTRKGRKRYRFAVARNQRRNRCHSNCCICCLCDPLEMFLSVLSAPSSVGKFVGVCPSLCLSFVIELFDISAVNAIVMLSGWIYLCTRMPEKNKTNNQQQKHQKGNSVNEDLICKLTSVTVISLTIRNVPLP